MNLQHLVVKSVTRNHTILALLNWAGQFAIIMDRVASINFIYSVVCSAIPWLENKNFKEVQLVISCLESRCVYAFSTPKLHGQKSLTAVETPALSVGFSSRSPTMDQFLPECKAIRHIYRFTFSPDPRACTVIYYLLILLATFRAIVRHHKST